MKQLGCLIGLVLMVSNSVNGQYSGGNGTKDEPYQIATEEDLVGLGQNPGDYDKYFLLTADISLENYTFTRAVIAPDTSVQFWWFQGPAFEGELDGGHHTIRNFRLDERELDFQGLIGFLGPAGRIVDLGLEGIWVDGSDSDFIGGLCAYSQGIIEGCSVSGSVFGSQEVGGVCGFIEHGSIDRCAFVGSVRGKFQVGGLCGDLLSSTINQSFTTGEVFGWGSVGGLCGLNDQGGIARSYANTATTGRWSAGCLYAGGLCGLNSGTMEQCYAMGAVTGFENVGGLNGRNSGTVIQCYASGAVEGGAKVGGLCGDNTERIGPTLDSFWDIETSDQAGSVGGTGLTTAEMLDIQTYQEANWDFTDADGDGADWQMVRPGGDYPRLAWQEPIAGDVAGLWGVDLVDLTAWLDGWGTGLSGAGDLNEDGQVDLVDFVLLSSHWLEGI